MEMLSLKRKVYEANIELFEKGLVVYTWGNVSGIDRSQNRVVIKPSGVDYDLMTPDDMVVVDLYTGEVIDGKLRPSSDTPTHLELYREFPGVGGVAHTHSTCAVAFAQAGNSIPSLGTTHADYFYGDIPCSRPLVKREVETDYELNTGRVIVETFRDNDLDPSAIPGVLVCNHGPFSWGESPADAVYHSVVMEKVADMAIKTITLNDKSSLPGYILDKHYRRKHGKDAYYGQN